MDNRSISVLIIACVISCSGIIVNLIKKGAPGKIIRTKDDASLLLFRVLVPLGLLASLLFYFLKTGALSLPIVSAYMGYFLVVFGLIFRWIAIVSLGNAFTVKVSVLEDHTLKTDGVYSFIRHPSYAGLLLYYFGLGLVMQNWICILLLIALPLFAVVNRIQIEEKVLTEAFPSDYKPYQKRSWRLFPFVY